MFPMPKSAFKLVEGAEHLSVYKWNTKIAEHFFCKSCGVYTHHKRRSDPTQISINFACLDDTEMPGEDTIALIDGATMD